MPPIVTIANDNASGGERQCVASAQPVAETPTTSTNSDPWGAYYSHDSAPEKR